MRLVECSGSDQAAARRWPSYAGPFQGGPSHSWRAAATRRSVAWIPDRHRHRHRTAPYAQGLQAQCHDGGPRQCQVGDRLTTRGDTHAVGTPPPRGHDSLMQPEHVRNIAILHGAFNLGHPDRLVAGIRGLIPTVPGVGLRGRLLKKRADTKPTASLFRDRRRLLGRRPGFVDDVLQDLHGRSAVRPPHGAPGQTDRVGGQR